MQLVNPIFTARSLFCRRVMDSGSKVSITVFGQIYKPRFAASATVSEYIHIRHLMFTDWWTSDPWWSCLSHWIVNIWWINFGTDLNFQSTQSRLKPLRNCKFCRKHYSISNGSWASKTCSLAVVNICTVQGFMSLMSVWRGISSEDSALWILFQIFHVFVSDNIQVLANQFQRYFSQVSTALILSELLIIRRL